MTLGCDTLTCECLPREQEERFSQMGISTEIVDSGLTPRMMLSCDEQQRHRDASSDAHSDAREQPRLVRA